MQYLAVRGKGDPNLSDSEYKQSVQLLYAIAYTIKMSKKTAYKIADYFDFVVLPLEGFGGKDALSTYMRRRIKQGAQVDVNWLSGFNISHAQIGNLVKAASQKIKERQEVDSRYDAQTAKKQVPVLYLEGDGVMIKGTQGRLEFHRYQVCEGLRNVTYKRRERTDAKEFVSLNRLDALNEAKEYIANTYDLRLYFAPEL